MNPTLHNLRDLKLDSNDIEDISILSNNNLKIFEVDDMSIKQNPIKKGLNALKGAFFARSFDISLKIDKAGEEYKISADFNYPNIYIDFFINNINDLKNYLDFEKCNIKIDTDDINILNILNNFFKIKIVDKSNQNIDENVFYILKNRNNFCNLTIDFKNENNKTYNIWAKTIIIGDYNIEF